MAEGTKLSKDKIGDTVKDYYGKVLQETRDLKSKDCNATTVRVPQHVREAVIAVHQDVLAKYYGCGIPVPECVESCSVLDLGCGSGRDCYVLSKLVGPKGRVVGVEVCDKELALAKQYINYHTEKFGYSTPNVEFVKGEIDDLTGAGIAKDHYDLAVSNCVINLSTDKENTLRQVYSVLKEGGEFYFSDIYTDQKLPDELLNDDVLIGGSIAGALSWEDLLELAKKIGFACPRLVRANLILITEPQLLEVLGNVKIVSATYRLFKTGSEEKLGSSEKPGGTVTYSGGILGSDSALQFDHATLFKAGEPFDVDPELFNILRKSRFRNYFTFEYSAAHGHELNHSQANPFTIATPGKSCCSNYCK